MKRLATKAMLSPKSLTAAEKRTIYQMKNVPRYLKFICYAMDSSFLTRPLCCSEANWRRIFRLVHNEYRTQLCPEDSFSLCFEALREAVLKNKIDEWGYLYKSCINRHKNYIRTQIRTEKNLKKYANMGGLLLSTKQTDWETVDFELDLDAAIRRAGFGMIDSAICRMRLLDQLSFEDISKEVGLSRMGVWKRFRSICKTISGFLSDYSCEGLKPHKFSGEAIEAA